MRIYKVTTIIKAEKMTLGEYAALIKSLNYAPGCSPLGAVAASIPLREPGFETPGYFIGRPGTDGKTFNGSLPNGCGSISWCPVKVFKKLQVATEDTL